MRQVESLRKERDAAAAALAVAQRRAYEDAEQARKAIERMKECE
jgi:hypothetical protein